MNTQEQLQDKINNIKHLDFGDIINNVFELFKKTWLKGFVLILIMVVILIPFFVALYMPFYSSIMEQAKSGDYNPNDMSLMLMQSNFKYMLLGFTFVVSFISTGLVAGYYRIIKKIDFNEQNNLSDYFYFFKAQYLGKIFAIAAFSLLVALVNLMIEQFMPQMMGALTKIAFSLILSVYTNLFVVFFAFNAHLETSDFFTLSFTLGSKKWFLIFGLMLVTGIIGILGFVGCFIGMFFTLSIVYLPLYIIYKDVFGFGDLSGIEQIGKI